MNSSTDVLLHNLKNEEQISFVQDSIHIATKMRNLLLKPSSILPMGKKLVTISHLKMLINTVSKDAHGIVSSDIDPNDKQNYRSFEKISEDRVLNALKANVIDSEATITYLKITKQVISAFTEYELEPLERIYRIWHSVYFLRCWRKWILSRNNDIQSSKYSIKENFISSSSYTCIELNAYNLLHLIVKFRDRNSPSFFLPTLYQSQTCEATFRMFRSMTSLNWTKINFNLLELLHMIGRLELQNEIAYNKLSEEVIFPRIKTRRNKCKVYELPSNEEIKKTLLKAQTMALKDASMFGMEISANDICRCEIRKGSLVESKKKDTNNESGSDDDEVEPIGESVLQYKNFQDYSQPNKQFDENSKFIEVHEKDGSVKTVLKSSIVWYLSNSKKTLSADRLRRVQESTTSNSRKRTFSHENFVKSKKIKKENYLFLSNALEIGQWCLFRGNECNIEKPLQQYLNENYEKTLVGSIMGFRYMNGKNMKEKEYTLNSVPIPCNTMNDRGVEILACWYKFDKNFILSPAKENCSFFIDVRYYIASTDKPTIVESSDYTETVCKLKGNFYDTKDCILELYTENETN